MATYVLSKVKTANGQTYTVYAKWNESKLNLSTFGTSFIQEAAKFPTKAKAAKAARDAELRDEAWQRRPAGWSIEEVNG